MALDAKGSNFELSVTASSKVVIGDENSQSFKPHALFSKWGGESFVSLGIQTSKNITPVVENEKVTWLDTDRAANFYALPSSESLHEGGLEVELVLYAVPASPEIPFAIDSSPELVWHYQAETLSKQEQSFGAVRPENVKGSFAIYHNSNKHNQYQTGKVAHLYRPTATDAKGSWIWGKWTLGVGVVTAAFDEQWLRDAVYPVVIGPTLGFSSIGANAGGFSTDQFEVSGPFTMPSAGTATQIQFYGSAAAGSKVTYGIYNDNAGSADTLLSNSAELAISTSNAWNSIAIGGSLSNGASYWPSVRFGSVSTAQFYYDSVTPPPDGRYNVASTYSAGVMPTPAPSTTAFGGVLRSLYFDYTAGGGTSVALTGVSGTSSVGSVSPAFDKALTGVSGTGSVGSVSPALSIALTGVSGTGSVGSVSPAFSIPLTGVAGTGTVGTVTPNTGVFVALTGVTGTGSVGSVAPEFSIGLTGVGATGSVGSLGFPVDASGVTPGFRNFGLPNINRGETQEEKRARWVREGSIPTEPVPEIQDKPVPKPIDDAKAAKLREARLRIQADSALLREKIDAIEAKETTARREKDLLRAQQALQLKAAEEAFVNEQLEVIDIACVAMTVIRYTAGISTTAIF